MRTKKILTMTMALIMTMSMITGCGKETNTVEIDTSTVENSTEEISEAVEVASEESSTTLGYVKPESNKEVESQEEFVFTNEYAAEKLERLAEAYNKLIASDGMTEYTAIWDLEGFELYPVPDLTTSDGSVSMDHADQADEITSIYHTTLSYYYNNYVNNGGEYFDFADYILTHTYDEIINNGAIYDFSLDTFDTNDFLMYGARLIPSILSASNGTIETSDASDVITVDPSTIITTGNTPVDIAYQCKILANGEDTGIIAVFDKDGNLLNLNDTNMSIDFVPSFDTYTP